MNAMEQREGDPLLDPTQSYFTVSAETLSQMPLFVQMEHHLSLTAQSLSTLVQQSQEQMQHVSAMRRTMQWMAFVALGIGIALLVGIFYLLRDVIALFVISFLIAYTLDPFVTALERHGINRTLVVACVSLLLLGIALLAGGYLIEEIVSQIKSLIDNLPVLGQALRFKLYEWEMLLKQHIPSLARIDLVGQVESALREYGVLERLVPTAASVGGNLVPLLTGFAIIPFLTFFMLNSGHQLRKRLIQSVPNRYFEPVLILWHELDHQLGQYLRSRIIETVVLSLLAVIGLELLGIRFAAILGILMGVANLIPYFGPVLGTFPPALVALSGSHLGDWGVIGVILLSVGLQFIDNALLFPLIVGRSVDLGPIATILVVLIGSELFGLIGLLLAVPVAAMLKAGCQITYGELSRYWRAS